MIRGPTCLWPAVSVVAILLGFVVPAPAAATPERPPLAMGLSALAEWSTEQPFIDQMKLSRTWIGHLPGQWGGWGHAELASRGWLDTAGWPVGLPPELTAIEAIFFADLPVAARSAGGRYRLSYEGEGRIEMFGRAANVRHDGRAIWFDYTPGEGIASFKIVSTDPHRTGNYIRNVTIVKVEHIALYEAGARFNPRWIARIADLRAVRFMDWMATNHSSLAEWTERPRPADYTYTWRGAPAETMIALANEIAVDPWFTIPHRASDDFVRRFAELTEATLDPRRKAYVEYSNEVWNWGFAQASWLQQEARQRWGREGGDEWMQFAGMRAAEVATIWDEVFGPAADERLVKVISTQTAWTGLEAGLLEAPLYVAEDPSRNQPPALVFDAYGVTGYFSGQLGAERAPEVREWIAVSQAAAEHAAAELSPRLRRLAIEQHRFDAAIDRAGDALRGDYLDSVSALFDGPLRYQADVAARWGLDLVMYEGGTHVVGIGAALEDDDLTAFFIALNYSAVMGRLYEDLLRRWQALGGTLFNAYVDVAGPSKWGSWGALRHLDDANPRWAALEMFNRTVPAWWDNRPDDAFAHGATLLGTASGEHLSGTGWADIIVAGDGDDVLDAGRGDDRLSGGSGFDVAILPGPRADYARVPDGDATRLVGAGGSVRLFAVEAVQFGGPGDVPVRIDDLD